MTAFPTGVTVHLQQTSPGGATLSFGLPVPKGSATDAATIRVRSGGQDIAANAKEILPDVAPDGHRVGVRSLVVQVPATVLSGGKADLDVAWTGGTMGAANATYASTSFASPVVVDTAVRSIQQVGGTAQLVEMSKAKKTIFTGREPLALATFPAGYLAATGILGPQMTAKQVKASAQSGLSYLSTAIADFSSSAIYDEPYALNPDLDSVPDFAVQYEAWLYDRCATFLTAFAHTEDSRFLRHGLRACSNYGTQIVRSGANLGIFSGKPDPDTKYSHLRGLYAYYALTGDEDARAAGVAIADMWLNDPDFVAPYRQGHVRGSDKLWTERLLGTSLEGLYYGFRLTGDVKYLNAFKEMLTTAYKHITGDAAALAVINPGMSFPPQNCFIHSAEQQAEGNSDEPWCSIWMSELGIDVLLQYQEQTNDTRVDEIFVRLARFLRDTGSAYFTKDLLADQFLKPSVCDNPADGESRRMLVPLYGSGINASGTRMPYGDYTDYEHCTDATGLTAVALRALKRQGTYDVNPIGPFKSEGESFLAMHHEFSSCAARTFDYYRRTKRNPANWTASELQSGMANPTGFITSNKIGYPQNHISPLRKIGWWFNMSMLQFGVLSDAKIDVTAIKTGQVQPAGCP